VTEQGKDIVFVAHANYSLIKDPRNLFKIYEVVYRNHPFLVNLKHLGLAIEYIVAIALFGGSLKKVGSEVVLKIAQEAVYGYRDEFCETRCSLRGIREEKWGREPFEGPDRWNCIACDQHDFIRMLIEICDGAPYEEIKGFPPFVKAGLLFPEKTFEQGEIELVPPPKKSIEKLGDVFPKSESYAPYTPRDPLAPEGSDLKLAFRTYLIGLISLSLAQFLDAAPSNRSKINLCERCLEFFIAKTLREQKYCPICSRLSKVTREERRLYMQSYREARRTEREFERRADYDRRVKDLMEKLDISKEEAEEVISFDDSL
jgi:hypothetical protein